MGTIRRRRFKLGSYPKEDEFPYKHNYEAMRGGHSVNDIDTGWDANGIPYKKESENQRLFRFEQMIKKENNRNRKRKLLETITSTPPSFPAKPLINGTSLPRELPIPSYLAKSANLNRLE